ncbi:MAG: AMP-binding protein [Nitrospira sp.]|nr:AMP-binding protein [Nitrospira sp.]
MSRPRWDTLQALVQHLSTYGERTALVAFHKQEVETRSFADLSEDVRRLTSGLIKTGLQAGEPVVLYAPNRPEWLIACLALLHAGAVPVPVDSQSAGQELAHIICDSDAHRLVTVRSLVERLVNLGLDEGRSLILLDADENDPRSWRRLLGSPVESGCGSKPEEHALLFYTSGSSGRPKGVPLTHANVLSNLDALIDVLVYQPDERVLLPLPLHHVYPFMVGFLAPCALGLPIILPHSLTGPQMLRALRDGRVTAIIGVPRLYSALDAAIEERLRRKGTAVSTFIHGLLALSTLVARRYGFRLGEWLFAPIRKQVAPHLRTLVSGGAAMPSDLAWRLAGLGWQVAGGYGLTETSPILTLTLPGSRVIDTAGKPLPNVHLRIAEADPETGQGEIQAKGPNVFAGYRHLPDKTAVVFTPDGWFRTGDLGYLDREGYLHIVGRASSRITLPGGEKIWPERIEQVLDGAPSVRESAVLLRDGRLVGIVVPRVSSAHGDGLDRLTQAICAELDIQLRQLPSYCRLTDFVIRFDPLPRTRLGKLQRHKLTDLFEAEQRERQSPHVEVGPMAIESMAPEDRQLLEDQVALAVWKWLATRFPTVRLTPDTHMTLDLGLDSLAWLALTLELRDKLGVDLHEEAIARIVTVRDLLREAMEAEQVKGGTLDPVLQLKRPESLLDRRQRRWLEERGWVLWGLGTVVFRVVRRLMRTVFLLEVKGREQIGRMERPCLVISNHASVLDPLAIIAALPDEILHRTYWGGWTGIMFRNPLMRLISRAVQVLPIDQRGRPLADVALGAAALARGCNLVWFPEGGRSRDGRLQPFQSGIGLLAAAYPVPIFPLWVQGTFEALPTGAWWPRRRPVTIFFGEPIDPALLESPESGADRYQWIAATLHDRIALLGRETAPA